MATKAQYETEDSVSKEPKDKSFTDKSRQAIKDILKLKAASQFTPLDLGYGIYKYATGKDPLKDFGKKLNDSLNPQIDTGSVPVGTYFNSSDFDSSELNKDLEPARRRAKGGSVSSRGDGIAQRGKTKGRMC